MPTDAPATSLPASARSDRPTEPRRIRTTNTHASARNTRHSTKNERSLVKLIGPSWGRGTLIGRIPPPAQLKLTMTFSKKSANASVASAR